MQAWARIDAHAGRRFSVHVDTALEANAPAAATALSPTRRICTTMAAEILFLIATLEKPRIAPVFGSEPFYWLIPQSD